MIKISVYLHIRDASINICMRLHSLMAGPLLFGPSLHAVSHQTLSAASHLTLLTGFPKSSGHCSSPFAILSHFFIRS